MVSWVLEKSHIAVELEIRAEVDAILDVNGPGFHVPPESSRLDPVNSESLLEIQAIHGIVNGQMEIAERRDNGKIFDSYAYVSLVSDWRG